MLKYLHEICRFQNCADVFHLHELFLYYVIQRHIVQIDVEWFLSTKKRNKFSLILTFELSADYLSFDSSV